MTTSADDARLEEAIQAAGRALWGAMQAERPRVFDRAYWVGAILDRAMADPSFKVDMLRFVDVFPMLRTKAQVQQHIQQYLLRPDRELPALVSAALKASTAGVTAAVAQVAVRKQIEGMAGRFIAGESAREAVPELRRLHAEGIAFTVDLLGEATVSEAEADRYGARYQGLLEDLGDEARGWPGDDVIDQNHLGPIPRTNVSLKVSALSSQIDPADPVGSVAALKARVLPLALEARERNAFLNFDLEQWACHDITYDLFEEIATHPGLRGWPHLGIVVQAYLTESRRDLERLCALARARGTPITVRLVKGAYWDYEVVVAEQRGWACPVFRDKARTDANYEALSRLLLTHLDDLWPAFGSHNLRSLVHALVLARDMGRPRESCEVQMLYGMAEPERRVLRQEGYRVRVYTPVGALLPGMAYLVRRLLENTSNTGFLRLSHHDRRDPAELMQPPRPAGGAARVAGPAGDARPAPFRNCPPTDFTRPDQRAAFAGAVAEVQRALPLAIPVVIGGREESGGGTLARVSPSETGTKVAEVAMASPEQARRAVQVARAAWPAWRARDLEERAALLDRLGDAIEADRARMAALQCFEVGKPWPEADADVAEAVDFCRYYARQARLELGPRTPGGVAGEDNALTYEGRGVSVVIAPWNFPLAILTGMATAALVAGNTVVMKPAEQASAVAHGLYAAMRAVGIPGEVVQFLPGVGEDLGPGLVEHPDVAQIAFTGSKDVGLRILELAHRTRPGQPQVKRVVCEMGGKNAIIVDADADLDEAVLGVTRSAFGYAGQKCSACSRVLVHEQVADAFVERLAAAAASIRMGPAHAAGTTLGPVIDADAYARLTGVIRDPGPGAEPLFVGRAPAGGYFVPPALYAVADPTHMLMQRELFGPILAVHRVPSFERALEVATGVEFALTGAVYSRSPANLALARQRFRVGNLYLNRGSTGALVGRQPFGGFGMSGVGTKAGGPGYLAWFVDPRVVTENTMRRGFTPELES